MKKLLILTVASGFLTTAALAQTKKIAHRSHSGHDIGMLLIAGPDNLGVGQTTIFEPAQVKELAPTLATPVDTTEAEPTESAAPMDTLIASPAETPSAAPNDLEAAPPKRGRGQNRRAKKKGKVVIGDNIEPSCVRPEADVAVNSTVPTERKENSSGLFWLFPLVLVPTYLFCRAVR
jgi:hypothetical protein